jgi:pimeloyl-ACP methyl ester carboxylesterase
MDLVLLPGFMTDNSLWDDVLPALERLGHVHFGDLTKDDSIAGMARRVLGAAPDSFVLIGFSMGGYVAREVVRTAPDRVEALVLAATSARADTPDQARRKAAASENVMRLGFEGLSRKAVVASLHPARASDNGLIERIRGMGDRLGGDVFLRQARQARASDLDRLDQIRCPTLIVAAAQDTLRSLEEARELHAGIPGSVLTVIEGSGHMLPVEEPVALMNAIAAWWAAFR